MQSGGHTVRITYKTEVATPADPVLNSGHKSCPSDNSIQFLSKNSIIFFIFGFIFSSVIISVNHSVSK